VAKDDLLQSTPTNDVVIQPRKSTASPPLEPFRNILALVTYMTQSSLLVARQFVTFLDFEITVA
jgi:hypothetical protein